LPSIVSYVFKSKKGSLNIYHTAKLYVHSAQGRIYIAYLMQGSKLIQGWSKQPSLPAETEGVYAYATHKKSYQHPRSKKEKGYKPNSKSKNQP
jgi:hypothetical protein